METQGRMRKRVLFASKYRFLTLVIWSQPMNSSLHPTRQAADPQPRQAKGLSPMKNRGLKACPREDGDRASIKALELLNHLITFKH
jgi:hypothetical protein